MLPLLASTLNPFKCVAPLSTPFASIRQSLAVEDINVGVWPLPATVGHLTIMVTGEKTTVEVQQIACALCTSSTVANTDSLPFF
jgi:ABC-type thiamin/hydroxymethylpyrimidine transport system permease subunit